MLVVTGAGNRHLRCDIPGSVMPLSRVRVRGFGRNCESSRSPAGLHLLHFCCKRIGEIAGSTAGIAMAPFVNVSSPAAVEAKAAEWAACVHAGG